MTIGNKLTTEEKDIDLESEVKGSVVHSAVHGDESNLKQRDEICTDEFKLSFQRKVNKL